MEFTHYHQIERPYPVLVDLLVQFLKNVVDAGGSYLTMTQDQKMTDQGFVVSVSQKNRCTHRLVHEETERTTWAFWHTNYASGVRRFPNRLHALVRLEMDMRQTKKTVKQLFIQMITGLTLWELYELEQAVSDLIDKREGKKNPNHTRQDRATKLIDYV